MFSWIGRQVTAALTRIVTPEELELARYLAIIDTRTRDVADLQAEIESLTRNLAQFDRDYHARVGRLWDEIDTLDGTTADIERRTELHLRNPSLSLEDVERQVRREFDRQREKTREETQASDRFREQAARFKRKPAGAGDETSLLKHLFRDLAKRFHPDLARTETERLERTQIMQKMTAAFHDRDLTSLRELSGTADVSASDTSFAFLSLPEKVVWAMREVARLDKVVESLRGELHRLRASSRHLMWVGQRRGDDPLGRLESEARKQRVIARLKLKRARTRYEQGTGEVSASHPQELVGH
jgi:phage host-nuclease inhibitor protein Gam